MPVISLTTAAGAPGCTTTALGLALTWSSPTLLIEADPAGSAISAGYFRGTVDHSRGLLQLALGRHDNLAEALLAESHQLDGDADRRILLGLAEATQASALEPWWEPIATAVRELDNAGYVVVIDAGRLTQRSRPTPLLEQSDLVLVVCRGTLSSAVRTQPMAADLHATLERQGRGDCVALATIGRRDYPPSEMARALGLPVLLHLPEDARHARVLSDAASERKFATSSLARALRDGSRTLHGVIEDRRERVRGGIAARLGQVAAHGSAGDVAVTAPAAEVSR